MHAYSVIFSMTWVAIIFGMWLFFKSLVFPQICVRAKISGWGFLFLPLRTLGPPFRLFSPLRSLPLLSTPQPRNCTSPCAMFSLAIVATSTLLSLFTSRMAK